MSSVGPVAPRSPVIQASEPKGPAPVTQRQPVPPGALGAMAQGGMFSSLKNASLASALSTPRPDVPQSAT